MYLPFFNLVFKANSLFYLEDHSISLHPYVKDYLVQQIDIFIQSSKNCLKFTNWTINYNKIVFEDLWEKTNISCCL